jgi:hypothetical protein
MIKNKSEVIVFIKQIYYIYFNQQNKKEKNMDKNLYEMLKTSAEADKSKALLSLKLLGKNAVGIGDHSTGDFYKNAEEALSMLSDADDRLETLDKYFLTNLTE